MVWTLSPVGNFPTPGKIIREDQEEAFFGRRERRNSEPVYFILSGAIIAPRQASMTGAPGT